MGARSYLDVVTDRNHSAPARDPHGHSRASRSTSDSIFAARRFRVSPTLRYGRRMEFQTLFWLKPFVYFGVLFLGVKILSPAGAPAAGMLQLGLLALGRFVVGAALGALTVMLTIDLTDSDSKALLLAVLSVVGFGLWFATGRLALRTASVKQVAVFAVAAESLSLGLDSILFDAAQMMRFC